MTARALSGDAVARHGTIGNARSAWGYITRLRIISRTATIGSCHGDRHLQFVPHDTVERLGELRNAHHIRWTTPMHYE
jgi:hypothetical protein